MIESMDEFAINMDCLVDMVFPFSEMPPKIHDVFPVELMPMSTYDLMPSEILKSFQPTLTLDVSPARKRGRPPKNPVLLTQAEGVLSTELFLKNQVLLDDETDDVKTLFPKYSYEEHVKRIKGFPKSKKKVPIKVEHYTIASEYNDSKREDISTKYLSPHGIEFHGFRNYEPGTLLKIDIFIPNYWERKKKLVSYNRIDPPSSFRLLAKVVDSTSVGKRSKKILVLAETVNLDEADEKVICQYLKDKK